MQKQNLSAVQTSADAGYLALKKGQKLKTKPKQNNEIFNLKLKWLFL